MIDWLATQGADIIRLAALLAIIAATIWAGLHTHQRTRHRFGNRRAIMLGWLAAIGALAALFLIFGPAIDALQKFSCRHARDFALCMDLPPLEYW
jgi:hypothetical protein